MVAYSSLRASLPPILCLATLLRVSSGRDIDNDIGQSCSREDAEDHHFDVELEVDESLNALDQDDSRLVNELKNYYLVRPSAKDINWGGFVPSERMLKGQFFQAAIVDSLYGHEKRDGFFVEAGASDGIRLSNTLLFEVFRNWTGLLVEPSPDAFEQLLQNGRKAWSLGHCFSMTTRPQTVIFDAADNFGGILQKGRIRPGDNIPSGSQFRLDEIQRMRKFVKIQCFPLYSVLLALGNPVVDYLSLDIEGAELAVLKSLPWHKIDVRVISVEICRSKLNPDLEEAFVDDHDEIHAFLEQKGFRLYYEMPHTPERLAFEAFFIRKDIHFPGANLDLSKLTAQMET